MKKKKQILLVYILLILLVLFVIFYSNLDNLYVSFIGIDGQAPDKAIKPIIEKYSNPESDIWISFATGSALNFPLTKSNLQTPENLILYEIPPGTLQLDLSFSTNYLNKVYEDAANRVIANNISQEKLNVLGISLANAPAWKLANEFKAKNLVSIVPGADLSSSVKQSTATAWLREEWDNSNWPTQEEWDGLDKLSPINNLDNLNSTQITIYLSESDKMIPFENGMKLTNKLDSLGIENQLIIYKNSGHLVSIWNSLMKFAKERKQENLS